MDQAKFDSLLATTDDCDLCGGVFDTIMDLSGIEIDAAKVPEPCLTVTLVLHSLGIIGNGGFHYLFEGDFRGDANFRKTVNAYQKIGAREAHAAFQKALRLFPECELPYSIEERLTVYESHPESTLEAIDNQFLDAMRDTERLLATFIRSNRDAFQRALTRPNRRHA